MSMRCPAVEHPKPQAQTMHDTPNHLLVDVGDGTAAQTGAE
jgi:hypothetical protein